MKLDKGLVIPIVIAAFVGVAIVSGGWLEGFSLLQLLGFAFVLCGIFLFLVARWWKR